MRLWFDEQERIRRVAQAKAEEEARNAALQASAAAKAEPRSDADKAAAAGGKIHKRRFSIGSYGYIALVTDTEGNMIGLHSLK